MLEILDSWLSLMQQCPRHFRLSQGALEGMAAYALPAAGTRPWPSALPCLLAQVAWLLAGWLAC